MHRRLKIAFVLILVPASPHFGSPFSWRGAEALEQFSGTSDSSIHLDFSSLGTKSNKSGEGTENSPVTITTKRDSSSSRPIIGVLAQEMPDELVKAFPSSNWTSYISASYVKFLESAGARVVPILIDQTDQYYERMFNATNGLLLPGGAVSLVDSGYAEAARMMWNMATTDYYPIWGTCLGFEMLAALSTDGVSHLKRCVSNDQATVMNFTAHEWQESKIGQSMPPDVLDVLSTKQSSINFHQWCLTPENFTLFDMDQFWFPLATAISQDDTEFIALLESRDWPIWASQFHPEKLAYEWTTRYPAIPHDRHSIHAAAYFAEFFVDQARLNRHAFTDRAVLFPSTQEIIKLTFPWNKFIFFST